MAHFFFGDKGQTENLTMAERVKQSVRKETHKMLIVGAAALAIQSIFNLAIVISV